MIKKIRRQFIGFNMLVISVVFIIVGSVIFMSNPQINVHRIIFTMIVFLLLALAGSMLLAQFALKPIKEAWQKQLDFTADASHELRTPLAIMQTNLEIMVENKEETIQSQGIWLENVIAEQRRMASLVEELLMLSRGDANEQILEKEDFSLDEMVQEVYFEFKLAAAKKQIVIETELNGALDVYGDPKRIRQLLMILVDNAIKYMGRAGKIIIKGHSDGHSIGIEVSDSGRGIDSKDLPRVFERFYRGNENRSQEGSGLGLAIARWIVDAHQGKIWVESKKGIGTNVIIRLPLHKSMLPYMKKDKKE